jgi:hypothetical protein
MSLTTSLKRLSQLFIITDRNNQVKTFCCFWHFLQRFFNVIFRIKASSLKSLCKNRSRDATLCRQSTSTWRRPLSLLSELPSANIFCLVKGEIFCWIYSKYLNASPDVHRPQEAADYVRSRTFCPGPSVHFIFYFILTIFFYYIF